MEMQRRWGDRGCIMRVFSRCAGVDGVGASFLSAGDDGAVALVSTSSAAAGPCLLSGWDKAVFGDCHALGDTGCPDARVCGDGGAGNTADGDGGATASTVGGDCRICSTTKGGEASPGSCSWAAFGHDGDGDGDGDALDADCSCPLDIFAVRRRAAWMTLRRGA